MLWRDLITSALCETVSEVTPELVGSWGRAARTKRRVEAELWDFTLGPGKPQTEKLGEGCVESDVRKPGALLWASLSLKCL